MAWSDHASGEDVGCSGRAPADGPVSIADGGATGRLGRELSHVGCASTSRSAGDHRTDADTAGAIARRTTATVIRAVAGHRGPCPHATGCRARWPAGGDVSASHVLRTRAHARDAGGSPNELKQQMPER